jgi:hypothetical protein
MKRLMTSRPSPLKRAAALLARVLAGALALQSVPGRASPPPQANIAPEPTVAETAAAAALAAIPASADTRRVANWVARTGDSGGLPFIIIDKIRAEIFVFDDGGNLQGTAPVLLGMARGDDSPAGIGSRKLADIGTSDRITPSGRFVAGLGLDLSGKDILWIDYDAGIALHRVYTGNPAEHRLQRLATSSALDNRISYGCINVPVAFYERTVQPLFVNGGGIVYVLPESGPLLASFPTLNER